MLVVFISSGLVLVLLWGVKYVEATTNRVLVQRLTGGSDRAINRAYTLARLTLVSTTETLRRDVFLRSLHSTTYVLLVGVRAVEERLERFTAFVRRARRGVRRKPPANLPGVTQDDVRGS